MTLRILRIIPFHEPARRFGGVVTQAALTSRALAARGHRLTVLTSDLDVPAELPRGRPIDRGGYDVCYAPARRPWHRVPPYASPCSTAALAAAARDADIVMLNVGLTLWNRAAARAAIGAGVGYVYNAEGCLCPTRLAVKRLRKAAFITAVERRVIAGAARLIAATDEEAADYRALGARPEQLAVVPNGVVPRPLPDPAERAAGRRLLAAVDDRPVVLFLGRLDRLKGIDLLLEGLRAAAARGTVAHVAIAGPDDGCRAALEAQARSLPAAISVCFTGPLHGADVDRAFAGADIFALTSRSEGLPNAILEAAAAGLPCVITPACHVPEIGGDDAGVIVDLDPVAIGLAVAELAGDPERRARQGRHARAMASERFALGAVVDRLEAVLLDAAGRTGGR